MFKKRMISLLTSAAALFGTVSAFPYQPAVYAESTAVLNDFEVTYEGWTNKGDLTELTAAENTGHLSPRSMTVSNRQTPDDGAISEKGFYLDGGIKYDYSVFVKSETDETFNLTLRWLYYDEEVYESAVIASVYAKAGQWTELKADFAAPEGSENLTLSINTDSTADFSFDDVTVKHTVKNNVATAYAASQGTGLKDRYAKYFRVGNILNSGTVRNNTITALIMREYNSITCENEHKPDATMNQSSSTNTNIKTNFNSGAAAIMDFCSRNNIPMRGHVLTWHGQTPDWFFIENVQDANWKNYRNLPVDQIPWASPSVMNQRLESYIKNIFAAYASQYPSLNLYAYDVVNEAVGGDGGMRPRGFDFNGAGGRGASNAGDSPWQGVYGVNNTDWIRNAFTYARKYAPAHTKLFYNDFNEWHEPKRDYIINSILKPLWKDGILDGMGMQSHVSANLNDGWSGWTRQRNAMDAYAAIGKGFQVQLTELECSTDNGKYASMQVDRYRNIFEHAVEINKKGEGQITAICIWTPNDGNTWVGKENTPALHDANNSPKPAYDAVAAVVPQSEWGDGNNPSFEGNTPVGPPEPNEWGWYFNDPFEGDTCTWNGRGNSTVSTSGRTSYVGSEALLVENRTAAWQGTTRNISSATFIPGNEYSFSVHTIYLDGDSDSETFFFKLIWEDAAGEVNYTTIDEAVVPKGVYVQLSNTNFRIPEGARNLQLMVETAEATCNFYIDEAIGAVAGTSIIGEGKPVITTKGDVNKDGKADGNDLKLLQNYILGRTAELNDWAAGDLDGDGAITSFDAAILRKMISH